MLRSIKALNSEIKAEYLKIVETLFEQQKTEKTTAVVGLGEVSLSSDTAVEEVYAIKMIVRNLNHLFHDELSSLTRMFANIQDKSAIHQTEMPIAPEHLVNALVVVMQKTDLKMDYKIALYKTFEANVFIQLGTIYKEVMNSFKLQTGSNVIPAVELIVDAPVLALDMEWKNIVDNWRIKQAPSGYDLLEAGYQSEYEIYEILNGLEIIRHFTSYEEIDLEHPLPPLKSLLFEKLEAINLEAGKNINQEQEYILDFVSILFQHIQQDTTISTELRKSILQLEIPLSVLALGNNDFILSDQGAGRKLIDQLYDAVQFINLDEEGHFVIKRKIDKLIHKVCSDSSCGIDEIEVIVADFSEMMEKNRKRYKVIQERTLQLSMKKDSLALSKKIVNETIALAAKKQVLPEKISDFLFSVWQQYLLLTYVAKDEEPQRWKESINTMEMLIKSVVPPQNESARKETIKLLPALIKKLRYGLKIIAYDKQLQARFFKELAIFHVLLINKNNIKEVKSNDLGSKSVENAKLDADIEPLSAKVKALQIDQWMLFTEGSTRRYGQYVWHSDNGQYYLFVEKTGNKLYELSAHELPLLFDKGQLSFVSYLSQPFTKRVLSHI